MWDKGIGNGEKMINYLGKNTKREINKEKYSIRKIMRKDYVLLWKKTQFPLENRLLWLSISPGTEKLFSQANPVCHFYTKS